MAKKSKPKPVIISPQAKEDINNIIYYLSENWNQKIVGEFLQKLQAFYYIISINPRLFGYYNKRKNIRKYALTKQNIIYFRNRREAIEIITVFDGRQHPDKLKNIL
ncbi:MAG: type II toxin-antitoxin system RelE/ParE family toxin [Bacteroidota bacterium]|nr:type II toxin-antitoxin system RelE/ParE family toxin [Bacteroidota bacterium]